MGVCAISLRKFKFKLIENEEQLILVGTLFSVTVVSLIIFYMTSTAIEKKYQSAVQLINEQKWYQAEQLLKSVPKNMYQDAGILKNYAMANIKLDLIDKEDLRKHNYSQIADCLNNIPDDYQGIFNKEIRTFKNEFIQVSNTNQLSNQNVNASLSVNKNYSELEMPYILKLPDDSQLPSEPN